MEVTDNISNNNINNNDEVLIDNNENENNELNNEDVISNNDTKNDETNLLEESMKLKERLIDTEIYHINKYSSSSSIKMPINEYETFESREDINYPFDDDDHDDDSFPSNPWIFSDEESNLFDEDQYEDERNQIDDEEWLKLYNNDEIFNFIYNDKNLFPGYFQDNDENINKDDVYNIDDPDDRLNKEFKSKIKNNEKLDKILDNYFKMDDKKSNMDNQNNIQDSKIVNDDNYKDKQYEEYKYDYNKLFNDLDSNDDLQNITIESYDKSKNSFLKKYIEYKKKYYSNINESKESSKIFNPEVAQKEYLTQKRQISGKINVLKEDEKTFNEVTNDIHDIQNTTNVLLTDYINNTMKLCEYAKQKYPNTDISNSFINFDYNLNNAYKLAVPMSNELQEDITYRNMYIQHKDKYKMLLLSKKLINMLNEKRIQVAFKLGMSTLEYEKIKDLDYLTQELEKQRLKEMLIISKKLSQIEHFKCLKLISNEKQKKRNEKEKEYLEHLKNKNIEEKMYKKRKEAYMRVLKVKNQNQIEQIKNEEQKTKEINKKIEALNILNNEINLNKQNLKKTKYPLPEISKYEYQLNNPVKYIESKKFVIDDSIKKNKIHQCINNNIIIKKIIDEEQKEIKDKNTLKVTDVINNRKKDIYYSKLIENHRNDLLDDFNENVTENSSFLKSKEITFNLENNKEKNDVDKKLFNANSVNNSFENEIKILNVNSLSVKNQSSLNFKKRDIKFFDENDGNYVDNSNLNNNTNIKNSELNKLNINNASEKLHIPLPNVKDIPKDYNQLEKNIIPFSAKPSILYFNDFESGKRYVKKVTLTNTSCRVNTFKLLPLPIEIASYFEVQYKLQGMMSAGMTCKIEVIFNCPNGFNENITDSSINFEAAYGGIFKIPINCCAKQCIPKIISVNGKTLHKKSYNDSHSFSTTSDDQTKGLYSNQQINDNEIEIRFGKCISGGFVNKVIEIGNIGAIETSYSIRPLDDFENFENENVEDNKNDTNSDKSELKDSLNLSKSDINISNDLIIKEKSLINNSTNDSESNNLMSNNINKFENSNKGPLFSITKNLEGRLIKNNNINIVIKYSPPYAPHPPSDSLIDSVSLKSREDVRYFIIEFDNEEAKPIYIKCIGRALDVPIFIDNNVLDFKLCVAGSLYRNKIQIKNESNIALKFTVALANDKFFKSNRNLLDDIDINSFKDMGLNITEPNQFYIKTLPSFIESFEFSPQFAFAQPNEPFSIWFKLKIQKKISLKQDLVDEYFEIPVVITYIYGNVKCPLPVLLKGRITSVGIKVEPNGIIDFKNISVCEKGYFPIKITNNSLLPQKLYFQSKSPVLSVLNPKNESIIKLKSKEIIEVYLIFQPLETIKYNGNNMKIIGYTDHGLKFEIFCIGNGVQSALRLSENFIKLSTTSIGKVNTINIGISHNDGNNWKNSDSTKAQSIYDFKFGMPVLFRAQEMDIDQKTIIDIPIEEKNRIYDCLRITPNEGSLKPLDYAFLEVSFFPSEKDYKVEGGKTDEELRNIGTLYIDETNEKNNKNENQDIPQTVPVTPSNIMSNTYQKSSRNKKSGKQTSNDSLSAITIPERSSKVTNLDFIMPCQIKQHKNFNIDLSKLKIPFGMKTDINEKEYQQNDSFVIHLLISTSITQSDLIKDNKESGIYFGSILLNSESIYEIPIKNESDKPKKIKMKCLNPIGPFDLVCYLREIPPKSTFNAKILFRPTRPVLYKEICEFYTETSCIKLELNGTGIEPKVLIEPKNIEFNDVLLGEIGIQTLTINNQTTIPIRYKVHDRDNTHEKINNNGTSNVNFISAFHLNSYEGEVASMDKTEIKLTFAPDHESDNYYDFIYIEIIGIKEYQKIRVNGRCWQNSFYISGFDHNPDAYIEDPVIPPLEICTNNNNGISLFGNQNKLENTIEEEPKKNNKKKDKKSESNLNENVDSIPISLTSTFIHPRYKTMEFEWKISRSLSQKYNKTVYVIYTKEFNIVNGKIPSFVKTENKKIIPSEFNIEPYDNTFYVNKFGSITLLPIDELNKDSKRRFIIEPNSGSTENIATKKITVKIVDPILNFWSNYFKEGIELSGHSNQEENVENSAINEELNNNINNYTTIPQNIQDQSTSKPHSPVKGNQNTFVPIVALKTFKPEVIETCYKVVLKGGVVWDICSTYNCRDPAKEPVEGYCNSYSRVWIIKFITVLPDNPEIVD